LIHKQQYSFFLVNISKRKIWNCSRKKEKQRQRAKCKRAQLVFRIRDSRSGYAKHKYRYVRVSAVCGISSQNDYIRCKRMRK